jgi:hypothetical protein
VSTKTVFPKKATTRRKLRKNSKNCCQTGNANQYSQNNEESQKKNHSVQWAPVSSKAEHHPPYSKEMQVTWYLGTINDGAT